jgi:hypothetical protein
LADKDDMSSTAPLGHGSNHAADERRRRNRVAGDTQGWILPAVPKLAKHTPADDEAWEVRIHDVSRLGVGFTSTEPMRVGEEHRLRIGRGPMKRARVIRVVACRQGQTGAYSVGAEFVDTLPDHVETKAG